VVIAGEPCPSCGVSVRGGDIACAFCGTVVAERRVTALSRLRDHGVLELSVLGVVTAVVVVTWALVLLHR
jgi:hypothetical protein